MNSLSRDELGIAEQAAQWFTTLEEDRATDRAAFAEWISRSPLHVQEFLNISAVHRMFEKVDPERRLDVEVMLSGITDPVAHFPPSVSAKTYREPFRLRGKRWLTGLAASLILTAGAWWAHSALTGSQHYSTLVGEQRTLALNDGSLVYLNTASEVAVSFNAQARDVRLDKGEALFTVEGNPRHPFRVHAGDVVIQAIGTQFNVRLDPQGTRASVVEGSVVVTDTTGKRLKLAMGEAARLDADGKLIARTHVDTARVTAWRQRRLVFEDDTLADMAAEFNRYNRALKIRIEGQGVGERRFTGTLDADNPESLLRILTEADDLAFEKESGALVIRQKVNP